MRAWIGCLAAYNNGTLHGQWFDVSTDPEVNRANIAQVLRSSPNPNIRVQPLVCVDCDHHTTHQLGYRESPTTCACGGMLRTDGEPYNTAEEAYVADYDETPRALVDRLGEYPSCVALALAAELLDAVSEAWADDGDQAAGLAVYLDRMGHDPDNLAAQMFRDWVSDHYRGSGDTRAAWTEEWMNETGFFDLDPPPGMRGPELEAFQERAATICRYFDFDAYSRDLECSGFTFERSASGVLVFSD